MINLIFLCVCFTTAYSLSCAPCGTEPCQNPACCESGLYTIDACGCCLTCAKFEGERCGGPFGVSGTCSRGLRCLRQCECKTVQKNNCVFPFIYEGETYNKCTTVGSENEAPWCATEVDENGEVVRNTWEDCEEGCPGTSFECNNGFLFNEEGECFNDTEATTILSTLRNGPLAVVLDDVPSETSQKVAPVCPIGRSSDQMKGCKCEGGAVTKGLDGNPRGGCIPVLGDEEESEGWCFLDHVQDPKNVTQNCFEDSQWSVADGKFWSSEACALEKQKTEVCLTTKDKKCVFPFTYSGQTYNQCTTDTSENGAPWCAVEVDEDGEVIPNAWDDCHSGCPGMGEISEISEILV